MSHPPSNSTDDLTRLLVNELKIKRQELDASKENERIVTEKLGRYKQRAHDAEAKLETQMEHSSVAVSSLPGRYACILGRLTSQLYFKRPMRTNWKSIRNIMSLRRQKALVESEQLRKELARAKQDLDAYDPVEAASKLERYRQRARDAEQGQRDAEAGQREAEATCECLRDEMAQVKRELGFQFEELTALREQSTKSSEKLRCSEIVKKTNERIDHALHYLPAVDDYPTKNLKPVASCKKRATNLAATIEELPEDKKAILTNWRQQTFTENQILFGASQRHGYLLRPRRCVRFEKKKNESWFDGNLPHHILEPFEAFLQKTEKWYYIGTYRAFYICEAPWETFSRWTDKTVEKLVDATIVGTVDKARRHQIRDKYAAGELTAGYAGLQCLGFNYGLYEDLCKVEAKVKGTSKGKKRALDNESGVDMHGPNANKKQRTEGTALALAKEPFRIPVPS